jgi:hypothetical protein
MLYRMLAVVAAATMSLLAVSCATPETRAAEKE